MTVPAYQPTAEEFLPAADRHAVAVRARPSLSYWQDAWTRLRRNRRSLAALVIVVFLLLFTLLGPLVWTADPAAQDLSQVSRGPSLHRSALLVSGQNDTPEPGSDTVRTATNIPVVAGTATTESVTLQWPAVDAARSYRVFRHEYPPTGPFDLGLPLARLEAGESLSSGRNSTGQLQFRDRLALEDIAYWYTVQSEGADGQVLASTTLEVQVTQAMTLLDARQRGLIATTAGSELAGSRIILPAHPLGTDYLGRDMLARLMQGARTSLFVGIGAPLVFVLFGLFYGGISGYLGGGIDREMMRLADFVQALPFLLFMILFKILFGIGPGESGVLPMVVGLVLLSWPAAARLVRGQVLPLREAPYVQSARLMGAAPVYVIARHMAPNMLSVVLVALTFAIPSAIFTEAFLSFIGMGVVPPTPSWGSMCNDGIKNLLSHPHELLFPAALISLTVLAFNLLGDGLRDALDVKMRVAP